MRAWRKRGLTLLLALCIAAGAAGAVPVKALAEVQIEKVLATTSYTPVALMDVNYIYAATSTTGCYVSSMTWYDQNYIAATGQFGTEVYHLEIRLDAAEGYVFAEELRAYLNNSAVDYTRDASGAFIIIRRDYAPDVWLPTVVKDPGAETVTEGGWASFVSTATYCNKYEWKFTDGSGRSISCEDIASKFPTVTTSGSDTDKIIVRGIPLEMNGWSVVCTFSGPGGSVSSRGAKITVNPDPAKATPEPTPEPTPSAEPEQEEPAQEQEEPVHEHSFADSWESDAGHHWHQCACGEKSDRAEHTLEWSELEAATENSVGKELGVCSVCGYSTTREVQYKADSDGDNTEKQPVEIGLRGFKIIMLCVAAATVLGIAVMIARAAGSRSRRRRR